MPAAHPFPARTGDADEPMRRDWQNSPAPEGRIAYAASLRQARPPGRESEIAPSARGPSEQAHRVDEVRHDQQGGHRDERDGDAVAERREARRVHRPRVGPSAAAGETPAQGCCTLA